MPKLYIENGADRGHSYLISKDGPFFAGRDPAAQVPLRDEMVSRRQFQIEVHNKIHHLRDLDSRNGTFLNGNRVQKLEPLAPNDRIQAGEIIISFLADEPHPLLGQEIGGYKILDRVGRGGMGTVYRAVQLSLDRNVALKILAPHLVKNANFINLFIREARAAGGLSHPNIVQVYDVGVHDEVYFFSMEYIPHGSVEDILNDKGYLSLAHALRVIRDAALGLEYAEQKGFIHRDIKPGNLMVGSGGVVKIGDLGIARSTGGEERVSQKDGVSGSPHYIAPEQARGHDIDHRVDLYALGVSFYQILCGRTPFTGTTPREVVMKQIKEEPEPIESRVPDLPAEVASLVKSMMQKDPKNRIPSATVLLEKLTPLLDRYDQDMTTRFPSVKGPRWRQVGILVGAGLVLLVGAVIGTDMFLTYNNARKDALVQHAAWDETLDSIESDLGAGRLREARQQLERVALEGLDSEQSGRHQILMRALQLAEQEAQDEIYEQQARSALNTLQSELRPPLGEQAAQRLREFAQLYPGSAAADEAIHQADELTQIVEARAEHEYEARQRFEQISRIANPYLPDYAKVRLELSKFDVTKYDTTAAYKSWEQEVRDLKVKASNDWHDFSRKIADDRESQRRSTAALISDVEDLLRRLGDFDDFEETRLAARALVESLRRDL